ncbi:YgjV family protein [Flocculibacter collagenilyticus]|uniref:YgjV family protein n=1 Tax=Flocculibacter collagenilyticus TaxID=2744479 RepID=UPI0018F7CC8B|nr:YgjV family protein [Flocculibacter collagenilyticus]
MEQIVVDVISWIGLAICIGAFFIKDLTLLRIATLVGCSLLFVYYTYISVPQGIISNVTLVLINAFYLFRVATTKNTEAV